MKAFIDITGIFCCMMIFVQDLRTRSISLILLLAAGILFACDLLLNKNDSLPLVPANYLFIGGQLGFLYFYFVHIRKTHLNFFDEVMGWGDVLMFLLMGLIFPLPQFILFLLCSFLVGMAFYIPVCTQKTEVTIPLAGIMALLHVLNTLIFYCSGIHLLQPFQA